LVVKKAMNSLSRISGAMPEPLSLTLMRNSSG
jgi:hypothetical protein